MVIMLNTTALPSTPLLIYSKTRRDMYVENTSIHYRPIKRRSRTGKSAAVLAIKFYIYEILRSLSMIQFIKHSLNSMGVGFRTTKCNLQSLSLLTDCLDVNGKFQKKRIGNQSMKMKIGC